MSQIDNIKSWLQLQQGFNMITDDSPDSIIFSINHSTGIKHGAFMKKLQEYSVWIKPISGVNSGYKEYLISESKPS